MTKGQEALSIIRETGVIAIMRAQNSDQLLRAADAIQQGGVRAIEVTMTTPGALAMIEQAAAKHDEGVLYGVGSVLDGETARAAILAGAQFVVSPSFKPELVEVCRRYSVPVAVGAFTPTEVVTAWECGADMVKVFPASLGGPGLIKALKAPLPQVDLVPVGGVRIENTADFIRAGSAAVGVGSALIDQKLLDAGEFAALADRARQLIQEVANGRAD